MTSVLIMGILFFIVCLLLCFLSIEWRKQIRINAELKEEVARQKSNCAYLVRHMEELALIDTDEGKTAQKIREAKSDEEIAQIVSAIVARNNSKLQDTTKK